MIEFFIAGVIVGASVIGLIWGYYYEKVGCRHPNILSREAYYDGYLKKTINTMKKLNNESYKHWYCCGLCDRIKNKSPKPERYQT